MPEIDLTPTNEAAARALFAETVASNYMSSVYTGPEDGRAQARIDARTSGLAAWDSGSVAHETLVQFRELALALTLASWKHIARQVWDEAYTLGAAEASDFFGGEPSRNPYEEQA